MTGFLGLPSGAQKRDTNNLNNIFNYAMPTAQGEHGSGATDQGLAATAFTKMLAPGRTSATLNAAPAVNAAKDQSDAARSQEATKGTGRTGGTAELNREAGATTTKNIDDIINQNLMGGQEAGAKGLAALGSEKTRDSAELLGLGEKSASDAEKGDTIQAKQQSDVGEAIGKMAGKLLTMFGLA